MVSEGVNERKDHLRNQLHDRVEQMVRFIALGSVGTPAGRHNALRRTTRHRHCHTSGEKCSIKKSNIASCHHSKFSASSHLKCESAMLGQPSSPPPVTKGKCNVRVPNMPPFDTLLNRSAYMRLSKYKIKLGERRSPPYIHGDADGAYQRYCESAP